MIFTGFKKKKHFYIYLLISSKCSDCFVLLFPLTIIQDTLQYSFVLFIMVSYDSFSPLIFFVFFPTNSSSVYFNFAKFIHRKSWYFLLMLQYLLWSDRLEQLHYWGKTIKSNQINPSAMKGAFVFLFCKADFEQNPEKIIIWCPGNSFFFLCRKKLIHWKRMGKSILLSLPINLIPAFNY